MSKFIQFNVTNSTAVQPLGPISPMLVNVEDISTFAATGTNGGGVAKILVIQLQGRYERSADGATTIIAPAGNTLTITFSTSTLNAVVNPTLLDGQPNPFVEALIAAISQVVPSGVAVYQLGNDQSTAVAAPNGVQMYIRTAVFA